jgi:iron complex transport system substrate-binding protein
LTIFLLLPFDAGALCKAERIVILAPAAADIVEQLGCSENVVGVTNSIEEFPGAERVGTHINPCIECIAVLRPSFLITSANFPAGLSERLKTEQYIYEPHDMQAILGAIDSLGKQLGSERKAGELITLYSGMAKNLIPPKNVKTMPKVLYETRSDPLTLAGGNTIMQDALERVGFNFILASARTGQTSAEFVLKSNADYYIYQVGPMNMNPIPPKERDGWKRLRACVWKVDEKVFARPNTKIFEEVVRLNKILASEDPCKAGRKEGYKP